MPSMEHKILEVHDITIGEFTLIFTSPYLAAVVASIPGGILGDRYGIKIVIGGSVLFAGVLFILRGFITGFWGLFILTLLSGIPLSFIFSNFPKLVSVWFPPEEAGMASGIYVSGMGVGMSIGLFSGGFFPSLTYGSLLFGGIIVASAIIWIIMGKTAPPGKELLRPPIWEGVKRGVKSKRVIGVAIGMFFWIGGLMAIMSLLPGGLYAVYDKPMTMGGALTAIIAVGMVVGNIIFPVISDKFRRTNVIIIICSLLCATLIFIGWLIGGSFAIWPTMISAGILGGGVPPLMFEVPAKLPHLKEERIKIEHVAGATGIILSIQNIGAFLLPSYVLTPIMYTLGFTSLFLVSTIFLTIPAVVALAVREIGGSEACH